MERIITQPGHDKALNALSYEKAALEFAEENERTEDVSCSLLLKNLLMNNLKLLKINEIRSMLLF
ncbi:hypothetical protein AMR72_01645 [Flavobacterium psychrophilum]|nr:hypothetical protein AMR72_01645 [Flavobacterium psychrophilum]AOE51339.1 hypothetical protein ALW18_01645 [Flavobacterium psychrophilum]